VGGQRGFPFFVFRFSLRAGSRQRAGILFRAAKNKKRKTENEKPETA
jgi:hypothetical protein